MTQAVADKKEVNIEHVLQVNDLLQRVLKGSVNGDQMRAIALAIGSGQSPNATTLACMIKVAFRHDPAAIRRFLKEQVAVYSAAESFVQNLIDGDADPFVPPGLSKFSHKMCGRFEWNKERFSDPKLLYLDSCQKNGGILGGQELRDALVGKPVLNACFLDWLLLHPREIPESWKSKSVFFWGTIYSDADGNLCVRYLCHGGERWYWNNHWLRNGWDGSYPALLASTLE